MEAASAPSSVPLPDPRAVNTVAGLAEQLHRLRLAAVRPSPADNPLTLRELAVLTGLPHTTLGNAESGRVLPRVEVVYRFAQACGVPAEHLPWWTQARNRAAVQRRREPQPATRGVSAPRAGAAIPGVSPVAEEAPAQADRLRQELGGIAIEQAAEMLACRHPESVVTFLRELRPSLAARLLAMMDPVLAVGHLSGLPPYDAVACLNAMQPLPAARLLTLKPVPDAVVSLSLMNPAAAVATLLAMPTVALGQHLAHLHVDVVRPVVKGMPLQQRTELLAGPPLPEMVTEELMFSLGLEQSLAFLTTVAPRTAARTLSTLPADPAAGLLVKLCPHTAARLLGLMPAEPAVARLMELTGPKAAELLMPLPLRTAGALLSRMPVPSVARLLTWLPADRRAAVLGHIRAERAVEIRWHRETHSFRIWCKNHAWRNTSPATEGMRRAVLPTLAELATTETPPPVLT